MKTLLILRHAKSSWKHPAAEDRDRPLNKRGQRQAPEVGQHVRSLGLTPDLILSSPARRARETAVAVAKACGYDGDVDFVADFYPGEPTDYLRVISNLPDTVQTVMVVGHNPGMEDLLAMLLRRVETMGTAALAHVNLPVDHWWQWTEDTRGNLVQMWKPAEEEQ